eukprot:TRINITY_DN16318_c0_g1_i1.p1 TRINITY_DN16318_c0_g1~~TRINITY_DN16318_c0_g1_i1.p1  ORF type:complete len:530 (+),score=138.14 TRINITY_DN16318_c0_g1_i1:91-1680(+)
MLPGISRTVALPADFEPDSRPESPPQGSERRTAFVQGRRVAMVTSVFNLLNAILGSGVLGLPYIMRSSGIGLFVFLILIMAVLVDFSLQLLLAAALTTNTRNYPQLGYIALGEKGHRAVCLTIMLQNVGGIISYFTVVKDVVGDVMDLVVSDSSIFDNRNFTAALICIVLAFPIALSPKIGFLGYVGLVSFATFVYFSFFVIVKLAVQGSYCDDSCELYGIHPTLDTFLAVPTMCFSFVCHTTVLPVAEELEEADRAGRTRRERQRMATVIHLSVFIAFVVYTTVSLCGYLTFRDTVKKDLLKSYADRDGDEPLSVATRLLFALAVLFGAPLLFFPFRKSLWSLIDGPQEEGASPAQLRHDYTRIADSDDGMPASCSPPRRRSQSQHSVVSKLSSHLRHDVPMQTGGSAWWLRHVAVTFTSLGVMLLLAISVPHITVVFGAAGATSSVALVFVLPSIIFEKTCMDEENLREVRARGSYQSADAGGHLPEDGMPGAAARWGPWIMLRLGVAIFLISWGGLIYNWSTSGFG